jgi:Ulp1 family protease
MAYHNSNSSSSSVSFRGVNSHFQSDEAYALSLSILQQQSSSSSSSSSSGDYFVPQGSHKWTTTTTVDEATDVTLHINTSDEEDQIPNNAIFPLLRNIHLTETQRTELTELLNRPETNDVLIDKFNIDMTVAKIRCLRPRTWLNDEVINFYLSMLQSDFNQCAVGQGKIYSFSTFFMVRLLENNTYKYANVARWTKRVDIFSFEKVFIPINIKNMHWTLIVIDFTMKTIIYYDALRGNGVNWITPAIKVIYLNSILFNLSYYYLCF